MIVAQMAKCNSPHASAARIAESRSHQGSDSGHHSATELPCDCTSKMAQAFKNGSRMPMKSVLIVYGTTEGQTRKIAEYIADNLK